MNRDEHAGRGRGGQRAQRIANASVFSTQNMYKVELVKDDVTTRISGQDVSGSSGDVFNVHESMATFLALKGWAIIH